MKCTRKFLAWILSVCLVVSLLPGTALSAAAEESETGSLALTGNTGATLTCDFTPLSAEVDNNDLAIVEIRGNTVRVIGKDGAVGVARLTVESSAGYQVYDIPIGYTTFAFNGDQLTVIPGSSANYEVAGVNSADEEYLVGDATYTLPVTTDENGYSVYENTDTYKLCVGLKKAGGIYVFTGTGADSCIAVKKAATAPTTILLAGLDLTSSFTAPITIKKESTTTATITALAGYTNTLTDADFNNADTYGDPTEDGGDGTNTAYAESAVIKGKSNANLTLNGEGTLNLVCNTKNALKVGEYGSLTIDGLTLNVTSAKNGISSDNTMVINGGNITVTTASGDCIRTDPDTVDANAGCAANIVINGGTFNLHSASDGIQSAQDLTINGGDFTIQAGAGYNDSSFDKDTMSCKGIKGTNPSDDETAEGTNVVTINGGTFHLNTADDAIHSDGTIAILGGEFDIQTGDDGVHADTRVDFGAENAADCKIHLTVSTCYEGLESKDVYIWSGCYSVRSSDDGINAAGGSSNGTDPGGGGFDPWNPGGGGSSGGDYSLNVKGGLVNVNADGDGLDSNGALSITGGSVIVWGQATGGDNSPLDCDGTMTVNGGTVFAGGTNPMNENPDSSTSQPYVKYGSSGGGWGGGGSSITAGKTVVVKNASSQVVFSIQTPKNINYALYSSPSTTSSWSITSDSSTPTASTLWAEHSYGAYVQTTAPTCTVAGVSTATCSVCGDTVTVPIAPTGHSWSYVTVAPTLTEEGYDLYTCSVCGGQYRTNFTEATGCSGGNHSWDEGVMTKEPTCTEDGEMFYTCSVCGATKTEAIPALGHDFNEDGVCQRCGLEAFKATFVCSEGCSVTVYPTQDLTTGGTGNAAFAFPRSSADGSIDVSGEGQVNFVVVLEDGYRVESVVATPTSNYKNLKANADATVANSYRVTKITDAITITVTATDQACDHEFDENGFCIHCGVEAPKVVFTCDEGCSVTAYPTQDMTTGGVENATVALARDSATGEVDLNGNGQVNFVLNLKSGYELVSVTPGGAYKNLKGPADTGVENGYRVTKITGTATIDVVTRQVGYTVHFSVPAGVTQPADMTCLPEGSINLPTVEAPEGYTFLGWVVEDYDNVTDKPAEILTGDYTATEEITLKALFTYVDGEGTGGVAYELLTAAPADWAGNYVITNNSTTTKYVAKGVTPASNGASIENTTNCSTLAVSGITMEDNLLTNVAEDYVFTLAANGSYYTVQSVSTGTYVGMNASSYLSGYTAINSTYCNWTPAINASGAAQLKNAANGSYPYLGFSTGSNYFWGASTNYANVLQLWKEVQIGTAYYTTELPHEHTPAEAVKENEVAATCEEAGHYDSVVYCTVCGEEISRETVEIPALGHKWGTPTYEWAADNSSVTATVVCENDESHVITETVDTTYAVITEPTTEAEGLGRYTAVFTNELFATQTRDVVLPQLEIQGYHIYVTNKTAAPSLATTTLNDETLYSGEVTFTVTCAKACVVAIANADGTYTKLDCTTTDSGEHAFTVPVTDADVRIVVALRGDANLDGKVSTSDATLVKQKYLGTAFAIDANLQALTADANKDGKISTVDASVIKQAYLGSYTILW